MDGTTIRRTDLEAQFINLKNVSVATTGHAAIPGECAYWDNTTSGVYTNFRVGNDDSTASLAHFVGIVAYPFSGTVAYEDFGRIQVYGVNTAVNKYSTGSDTGSAGDLGYVLNNYASLRFITPAAIGSQTTAFTGGLVGALYEDVTDPETTAIVFLRCLGAA